jgi:iron complex transport system substrate-binding protein
MASHPANVWLGKRRFSANKWRFLYRHAPVNFSTLHLIVIKNLWLVTACNSSKMQLSNISKEHATNILAALGDRYENRTISVASTTPSNNYVLVKNSFSGSILDDVGLQRPAAQDVINPDRGIFNISEERLDILDGDILFLLYTYDWGEMETYQRLKKKPIWKQLKAVKNNQVFLVDFWTWTWSDPSAANAVIDDLYKYLVNTP